MTHVPQNRCVGMTTRCPDTYSRHARSDAADHSERLVPKDQSGFQVSQPTVVVMQVAAARRAGGQLDCRVGFLLQPRVGDVLDSNVVHPAVTTACIATSRTPPIDAARIMSRSASIPAVRGSVVLETAVPAPRVLECNGWVVLREPSEPQHPPGHPALSRCALVASMVVPLARRSAPITGTFPNGFASTCVQDACKRSSTRPAPADSPTRKDGADLREHH